MAGEAAISGLAAGLLDASGDAIGIGAEGLASAAAGVIAAVATASGDGPELTGVLSASSLFWQEIRRAADRTVTKDLARAFMGGHYIIHWARTGQVNSRGSLKD